MQIGESLDELADPIGDAFSRGLTFFATSFDFLGCYNAQMNQMKKRLNQFFDTVFLNGYFGLFVSALSFLSILFCSYTQAF
jgi:hypothetical protein